MGTVTMQEGYREFLSEPGLQQRLSGSQNEDAKRESQYFDRTKGVYRPGNPHMPNSCDSIKGKSHYQTVIIVETVKLSFCCINSSLCFVLFHYALY
jgi:hypothetical protein